MSEHYILAIDQGTSGTKSVLFDQNGRIVTKATSELRSYYPKPGFVEQDPDEIYKSVLKSVKKCLEKFSGDSANIAAIGISNQRETFVLWDRDGRPLTNAIVWQCKRSVDLCTELKSEGMEKDVMERTGLIIDPYFSGTKLIWLYRNDPKISRAIDDGRACFGTIDSWLLYKLTGGKSYFTDYTNASRTLLFNLDTLDWDHDLLVKFKLSTINLPKVKPSSFNYGETDFDGLLRHKVRIGSMIGDSHAAAFGEGCFSAGMAKATLGTGSSILMNTGDGRIISKTGMMRTICWSTEDRVDYALEGVIVTCGATIKWLENQVSLFDNSAQTESIARKIENNGGVYFIPAFSGLGAPHWKMEARAAIMGLTFGSRKEHIVRAALESIPFQIKDVIGAMEKDYGLPLTELKVDGGITSNKFVIQFLADLLNIPVSNMGIEEVSALGAAYLAGLHVGIYENIENLKKLNKNQINYQPGKGRERVVEYYEEWLHYVHKVTA